MSGFYRFGDPETVEIRQPFLGVACYCMKCRAERWAPWLPAACPVCARLMRVAS